MSSPSKYENLRGAFLLEKHRVESYKTWPFGDASSCSKLKMAQAGFFWTGTTREPDTATCFVCNKTLDGWENTDEPWKEHAKHAPQCLFVKNGRPESEISVREFLEIFVVVVKNKASRDVERAKTELQQHAVKEVEHFTEKKN